MSKGVFTGIKYFLIHLCVEIVCFMTLFRHHTAGAAVLIALVYDFLAFLPQGIFGELMARYRKIPFGTIGVLLLALGVRLSCGESSGIYFTGIAILALGNAILHACGAVSTVAVCDGRIFPSALFVAGGSFGVITGQTLGAGSLSLRWLIFPLIVMELLLLFSAEWKKASVFPEFHIVRDKNANRAVSVLLIAFFVTAVRSFIGYAIPLSWKTESWQTFLLFFAMGTGKAAGGLLIDLFGARRISVLSALLAVPFLIAGDSNMILSITGVCLFSMTMSVTFAMCLSVLPQNPGLAFGVTTIGLVIGLLPVFFYRFGTAENMILVIVLSIICAFLLFFTCNNSKPVKESSS